MEMALLAQGVQLEVVLVVVAPEGLVEFLWVFHKCAAEMRHRLMRCTRVEPLLAMLCQ